MAPQNTEKILNTLCALRCAAVANRLHTSENRFLRERGKLDSLPYIRDAVFIVSGRHHSDLNDSSGFL
jgi:hypothetical protein